MAEIRRLYGVAAAGRLLGKHKSTIHTRYTKGDMPEPDARMSKGEPLWYRETLLKHQQEYEHKERNRNRGDKT